MLENHELRILQNNLHQSLTRTHSILNHPDTKQYAILLLQEQHWIPKTKSSPLMDIIRTNDNKQQKAKIINIRQ